ncbi:MAG: hypothetical protein DRG25_05405 [Deltaproteobacteria bacterium]|nr:MAG: hypothetical protein DRG25_05405 [Deltaproteobacteria bacterium]
MECSKYKEQISAYIDDELSKKELKQLLRHFESCSECKEELSKFLLQREKLLSLRSSYSGPLPSPEFSQKVMAEIEKENYSPQITHRGFSKLDFLPELFSYLKKPAFAFLFSFIIVVGFIMSIYFFESFPLLKVKNEKLMSVYELKVPKIPSQNVPVVDLEREGDSIIFHHIAYSSTETFAAKPCLLEYAAYTSASGCD